MKTKRRIDVKDAMAGIAALAEKENVVIRIFWSDEDTLSLLVDRYEIAPENAERVLKHFQTPEVYKRLKDAVHTHTAYVYDVLEEVVDDMLLEVEKDVRAKFRIPHSYSFALSHNELFALAFGGKCP